MFFRFGYIAKIYGYSLTVIPGKKFFYQVQVILHPVKLLRKGRLVTLFATVTVACSCIKFIFCMTINKSRISITTYFVLLFIYIKGIHSDIHILVECF